MELLRRMYLTHNLSITRDEHEIVDYLIDHKQMPVDFDKSHVTTFYVADDLHLVIYFCDEADRGFQMYIIEDFSQNVKELNLLRDLFGRMVKENPENSIFKQAHYKLDSIAHMAKTLRAVIHKDPGNLEE